MGMSPMRLTGACETELPPCEALSSVYLSTPAGKAGQVFVKPRFNSWQTKRQTIHYDDLSGRAAYSGP